MPHEISTKFLKDVATKSLSYNIENSKSKYLPMDLIEDYWEKNEQRKRNTYQTQNDLKRIKEKLLDKEFKAKLPKQKTQLITYFVCFFRFLIGTHPLISLYYNYYPIRKCKILRFLRGKFDPPHLPSVANCEKKVPVSKLKKSIFIEN